jgi:divalent metal cation (Fe/Co/Zn/Cd) transporter
MNLALTLIVFFMIYWNRTFNHHMITAIAMAAYTFSAFSMAIVNVVKYKKYNSPVFSASKAISFASACVSMLTLTSTLLTTFNDGKMDVISQKIMLGSVGFAVSGVVVMMAIFMILRSTKKLKLLDREAQDGE